MTRKQAKIFARIYSAASLSNMDGFAFMDNDGNQPISADDENKMIEEVLKIAVKIQGNLPEMSTSFEIYKYVIENF